MKKGSLFSIGFFVVSGYLFLPENPAWAQTCGGVMPGSIHHWLVFGNFTRNIEYGGITTGAHPREEEAPLEMARRFRRGNPPGPAGGPGTNWENPPGPKGGSGASPD